MGAQHLSLRVGHHFGRYEILARLAVGGMAEVWLAQFAGAAGFHKKIVLKTMLPHLASTPEFVQLFVNEASIAAQFNHPNIVHTFDFGELDARYFIAMEYVLGRSLRQAARKLKELNQLMPVWFLLHVLARACDGLQYMHDLTDAEGRALNLVHRDISPENIMVSFNGTPKIVDFGVAQWGHQATQAPSENLAGKIRYMAPERVRGGAGDRRSDVYAMGTILYECLTGVRAFQGDEVAILYKVLEGKPRKPRELNPNIPPALEAMTLRAMAANPGDRYSDADELGNDLRAYLRNEQMSASDREIAQYILSLFPEASDLPTKSAVKPRQATRNDDPIIELDWEDVELADVQNEREDFGRDRITKMEGELRGVLAGEAETIRPPGARRSRDSVTLTENPVASVSSENPSTSIPAPAPLPTSLASPTSPSPSSPPPSGSATSDLFELERSRPSLVPEAMPDIFAQRDRNDPSSPDVFASYSRSSWPPESSGIRSFPGASNSSWPPRMESEAGSGSFPKPDSQRWATREIPKTSENRAAEHFERGMQHVKEKAFDRALGEWEAAEKLDPSNRTYKSNLKRLRERLGRSAS